MNHQMAHSMGRPEASSLGFQRDVIQQAKKASLSPKAAFKEEVKRRPYLNMASKFGKGTNNMPAFKHEDPLI
jgi:hypothetical protein